MLRTEVFALGARGLPEEDEQQRAYLRVATQIAPDPVVIRCFDLGGDKALPGEAISETNPQLGWRAIRILLDRPELFRAQLRAIVRANVHGNLRIMLPMIASLDELEASREHLAAVSTELGVAAPPLGVMIETPAAVAIAPHLAIHADFFSIGTNDLMQYMLATDRENERVAALYDPFHPGVLAGIQRVSDAAREAGIPCSVCGELGGSPIAAPLLIGMGIEELSMAPFSALVLRQVVRRTDAAAMVECARDIASAPRGRDVRERLTRTYQALGLLADPDLGPLMRHLLGGRVDRRAAPR